MRDVVANLNNVNEYSLRHVKHYYIELKLLIHPSRLRMVDARSSGSSSLPSCDENSANEHGGAPWGEVGWGPMG